MYRDVCFITKEQDEKILGEIIDYIKEKYTSKIATFSTEKIFDKSEEKQDCLFLLYLSDDEIKTFFQNHLRYDMYDIQRILRNPWPLF